MAPEQATGAPVDARADQFSFCVALHEALYGARPAELRTASSPPRLQPAAPADDPREARMPLALQRVVRRGLADDPRDRYPSMAALLADLERIAGAPRRRRRLALLAVAATALAVVALVSARWIAERVTRARAQARCTKAVAAAEWIVARDPTIAAALLRDAPCPDDHAGWLAAASGTLQLPVAEAVLHGLSSPARSAAYSPDGRYLAVAVNADVTQIWRRRSDGFSRPAPDDELPGGKLVRFRSDGAWLATVSDAGEVRVWDMSRLASPRAEIQNREQVVNVHFLPDREGVFWLLKDGALGAWQPGGGVTRIELALGPRSAPISNVAMDAGGQHIAIWDAAGSLAVWRMTWAPLAAERLWRANGDTCRVSTALIARQGRALYAGCVSGDVERRDIEGKTAPEIRRGHSALVHRIAMAEDGGVLTASIDNTALRWSPSSPLPSEITTHDEDVILGFSPDGRHSVAVSEANVLLRELTPSRDVIVLQGSGSRPSGMPAFSEDGRRVAVAYSNGEVRVWSLDRRDAFALHGHRDGIWSARLDAAGSRLVTAAWDGTVRVWDLARREPVYEFRGHEGHHVYTAEADPQGGRAASGANDGTAQIWRIDGGGEAIVLPDHEGWAYAVAWSPDGHTLATGSQLGAVRLWDASLRDPVAARLWYATLGAPVVLAPPEKPVSRRIHALAFSPDGGRLFAASQDGTVRLWHLGSLSAPAERHDRDGLLHSGTFSPDGRLIAVGVGATVFLLDGTNLAVVRRLEGHEDTVFHVAFSPDGLRLVTSSQDWTARVWRVDGRLEHTFYGHTDAVTTAAFDRVGRRVITGSSDGIVRVWRLDAPAVPTVLRGHTGQVRFAAFTPDGDHVVTASMDRTTRVWSLPTHTDGASLRRQLRAATTACLTASQRIRHLGEPGALACDRSAPKTSHRSNPGSSLERL
jgi:WD40 repeat protein